MMEIYKKKEIQSKPPIRNETYQGGEEYGENGLLYNRSKNIDPSV